MSDRSTIDPEVVAANLAGVRGRIAAAGADPDHVRVVAVTKGFSVDAVRASVAAGVLDIGENYAQELTGKAADSRDATVRWHFLGPVQRNKVARLAGLVHLWHGLDRVAAGEAIATRASGAAVLVQLNVSGEPSKAGCRPEEAPGLVRQLRALGLQVRGLMGIGPSGPPEQARAGFRDLARLADELALPERSMGMTDDLEVAVQEGATIVRIGEGLFGPRPVAQRARR